MAGVGRSEELGARSQEPEFRSQERAYQVLASKPAVPKPQVSPSVEVEPSADEGTAPVPATRHTPPATTNPETVQTDPNPLNPAGDSLDALIQMRMNEDLWTAMRGELPCLDSTEPCIRQLQQLAVNNARELKAIDQRVEVINQKIAEAKQNNQATVRLGVFEPLVQSWLKLEDVPVRQGEPPRKRGLLDRLGRLFLGDTLGSVNEILSLIGVPLFRNATGGDPNAQARSIAIADLQVKVAEVENKRGDLVVKIREQVLLQVLEFDQLRREFQISQEIARRQALQLKVMEVGYRFGGSSTEQYLGQLNSLDRQKGETFRQWARVRTQLTRVKLLVLRDEDG